MNLSVSGPSPLPSIVIIPATAVLVETDANPRDSKPGATAFPHRLRAGRVMSFTV
jgi:hypothetical protein